MAQSATSTIMSAVALTSTRRVVAVGRISQCSNCGDFPVAKVRTANGLQTVTCPECTTSER